MNSETRMPASRRPFLALLGHDAGGMRAVTQRDIDHLVGRRHLEIERQLQLAHQAFDVAIDDVPAILAQMGGDAVGARGLGDARGPERIGQPAAARVAHRGDVIDVHAKAQRMECGHITRS